MKNFTYLFRLFLLCILLNGIASAIYAQQVEKHLVLPNREEIGFLEYKPANYQSEGNVKHPVIIFLHGIGERGNGTTQLRNVSRIGLPRMIRLGHNMQFAWNGKKETFLVVSPQCPKKYSMWPELIVNEMISYVKQNLRVDTNRIYITGLSMGGGGTYRFISRQQKQAEVVAAAATICAPCTFTGDANNVAKAKLPLWSFHAADDSIALAMCTESAVRKVNAANPEVKPLKTIWPTGGHNVWDRVYTDTSYRYNGVVNIYEWFLGQSKKFAPNKLPVANAGADLVVNPMQPDVKLNASTSYDPDGKIVRFVWKKIAGPAGEKIAQKMGALSSTAITGLQKGNYQFELAVVDNRAAYTKDTLIVTVSDSIAIVPSKPVRDTASAILPRTPSDTLVKDTLSRDTVIAKPAPKPNKAPIAGVTPDREIPVEWNYFPVVSGWPSKDEDGYIAKFKWQKISGPDSFNIVSPNTCATRINKLVRGVYIFRVTAFDNKGASSYADVKITMTTLEDRKRAKTAAKTANAAIVQPVESPVPVTEVTLPASFKAYPNPTAGLVHLEYTNDLVGNSIISIRDVSGRSLKTITFNKTTSTYRHDIELTKLPDGIYYVEIRTGNALGVQARIVKR